MSNFNSMAVIALSASLAKQRAQITEPARSKCARALMLLKPMLLKHTQNSLLMAAGANIELLAAIADKEKTFQAEFEAWLTQVNALE